MKRRLDSIIIGGAMLFGGIAHRRADHVAKQVDELGEAIEAVEDQLRETAARPERPAIPGMPLPTGYGLQVRGPDNESIILPVCLPPGFELDSMVLSPEFLPRDEPRPAAPARAPQPAAPAVAAAVPAPVPARAPQPAAPAVAAASPAPAPVAGGRERLSGTLQYVFGSSDPAFSMDETFGGAVDAEGRRPRRSSGVETHHLDVLTE
jgi:outer membrane murein-binding lipoprotein Lpp